MFLLTPFTDMGATTIAANSLLSRSVKRRYRILCVGDSITYGSFGVEPAEAYRAPIATYLTGQGISFRFLGTQTNGTFTDPPSNRNEGHGGYHTVDMTADEGQTWHPKTYLGSQIDTIIATQGTPDVIVIGTFCTNDMNPGTAGQEPLACPEEYGAMLSTCVQHSPTSGLVIGETVPCTHDTTWQNAVVTLNTQVPGMITQFTTINPSTWLRYVNTTLVAGDMNGVGTDGIHPPAAACTKMGNYLGPKIKEYTDTHP